jgi:hypothetical protein
MARGQYSYIKRQFNVVKACDQKVKKMTKGQQAPDVKFQEHFITLWGKDDDSGWQLQGYKCKHCEKVAATEKDTAVLHLLICTVFKKQKYQDR